MIELIKKVIKRIKCKHNSELVDYGGLCTIRYKCDKCGKSRVVSRFKPSIQNNSKNTKR